MIAELLLLKLLVAVGVVVGLSVITERISPRIAGIVAGLPTGTAITLFFIGLDNGTAFASQTALYNMVGLIAMQAMLYVYYRSSLAFKRHGLILSALLSAAGYFASIFVLKLLALPLWAAVLLPLASIPVFIYLLKRIPDSKIEKKSKLGAGELLTRALIAALIILAVIESASLVGPAWAGLFTAFPTTVFPLILIIHYTYDAKHVHTIIKHFPSGLASLLAYSLTISLAFPLIGIYWGTAAAFASALVVYAAIYLLHKRNGRDLFAD